MTRLKQIGDVLLAPFAEALLGDVGDPPLARQVRTAREALVSFDRAQNVPRAVAFGAVAGAIDQIGAAVPLRRFAGIRCERLAVNEQEVPAADQSAPAERQWQLV